MRKLLVVLAVVLVWVAKSSAQEQAPLRLVQTISLAETQRHWDHFGVDVKSNRLFFTSGDEPVVDVFDMRTNTKIQTITGTKGSHNLLTSPDLKKYHSCGRRSL